MAKRNLLIGATFVVAIGILAVAEVILQQAVTAQEGDGTVRAPRFEVDPFWPKPLPNNWVLGQTIGVWVDEQDVIWIVHRGSATLADNEKALELNPDNTYIKQNYELFKEINDRTNKQDGR